MTAKSTPKVAVGLAAAGAAVAGLYSAVIRPWHLRWGATDEDIARPMPLDDEVKNPTSITNRAVTIQARPEEIWPWLVQMGELPRGGFYSYEWVERLMGMKVANAEEIHPELQSLTPGQALDHTGNMIVKAVAPGKSLVLGPPEMPWMAATWALALYPIDETSTRLVSRVRGWVKGTARGYFWRLLLDPGQFVMERKMLLEIKRLAEAAKALPAAA